MKMNYSKTEITEKQEKLGSLLEIDKDIRNRKKMAESMFNQCWKLWNKKSNLNIDIRVKFYNTLIKPTLLYNCSIWGLIQGQKNGIETIK